MTHQNIYLFINVMSYLVPGGFTTISSIGIFDMHTDEASRDIDIPNGPNGQADINSSIVLIFMSSLIFLVIISWIEVIRLWYDNTFPYNRERDFGIMYRQIGYAVFITALVIILMYIIYQINKMFDLVKL